jgi:DnaJ-class molecular chaperone
MTADQYPAPSRALAPLARLFAGWVCGTCGGGGVASDGSTCPDCNGNGHT